MQSRYQIYNIGNERAEHPIFYGQNLGSGSGVFSHASGNTFYFKSIVAGDNITITPNSTGITISSTGGQTGGTITGNYVSATTFTVFTGTTLPANYLSKSSFGTYTGTTAPATYLTRGNFNTWTGSTNYVSGAANGLTKTGNYVKLGGTLTGNTSINGTYRTTFAGQLVVGSGTGSVTAGSFSVGQTNVISESYTAAIGLSNQIYSNANYGLAVGTANQLTEQDNIFVSGSGHEASGLSSAILGGSNNDVRSSNSVVIGGSNNYVNAINSVVIGGAAISGSSTYTVYMPKVRIGLGISGSLLTDDTINNVLVRDSSTGEIKIRAASTLIGSTGGGATQQQKTVTASTYTISDADDNYTIYFTNTCTVTFPSGVTENISFTTVRGGSGTITHAAGTGAVINTQDGAITLNYQNIAASWIKYNSTTYYGFGALGEAFSETFTGATSYGGSNKIYAGTTGSTLYFKSLVQGSNITLTESLTGITIASTGGGGSDIFASNGLTKTGDYIKLGGALTGNTTISTGVNLLTITGNTRTSALSASTVSLLTTPSSSSTNTALLCRNASSGRIETRSTNTLIPRSSITSLAFSLNQVEQQRFVLTVLTGNTTLTLSGINAVVDIFSIDLSASTTVQISMPSTVVMQSFEETDTERWDSSGKVLTLTQGVYELLFSYDGSIFKLKCSDPFI